MSERQIIAEYDAMLSRRHKEIVRQGVYRMHGLEEGKIMLQKIQLTGDHPLSNGLLIHKLVELTLFKQSGYDVVHDVPDMNAIITHHEPLHNIATILHCRYLLAHAREAGIDATMTDMISANPLTHSSAGLTVYREHSELSAFLGHLVSTAPYLRTHPMLIANPKYNDVHQTTSKQTALVPKRLSEPVARIREAIEATWADSRYGNTIYIADGAVKFDRGDSRAAEYTKLEDFMSGNATWIMDE